MPNVDKIKEKLNELKENILINLKKI